MDTSRSVRFRRVAIPQVPWHELDAMEDRSVFQTRAWMEFICDSQAAEPVVAEILSGGCTVGWFTGAIVRRYGARILGSPLPGWTTSYMGCNLADDSDRVEVFARLPQFVFSDLRCVHVEVMDRFLGCRDVPAEAGYRLHGFRGFELDIARSDEQILGTMTTNGRRDVRRSIRNGIEVEVVDTLSDATFALEYYVQVSEAFAKRSLIPPYPVERVISMLRHLVPTGHLLTLRAFDPSGQPVATGLFPGLPGRAAFFWMGASRQSSQRLLPNEALMWTALRSWRELGARRFDFGGHGNYKAKYGGTPIEVPWLRRSRHPSMDLGRSALRRRARMVQVRGGRRR